MLCTLIGSNPVEPRALGGRKARKVSDLLADFFHQNLEAQDSGSTDVAELAAYARPLRAHVNLIPLNPGDDPTLHSSSAQRALAFESRLRLAGVAATIRVNRGRDSRAACGQLRLAEKKRRERQPVLA